MVIRKKKGNCKTPQVAGGIYISMSTVKSQVQGATPFFFSLTNSV